MPEKKENIFLKINNGYAEFTASEKKMADYVLSHKTDVQYMSITELAVECHVGEATVSRFCKRLDLKGYNGFKIACAKSLERESQNRHLSGEIDTGMHDDSVFAELLRTTYADHTRGLVQTMSMIKGDSIKEAVEVITEARMVYCMGQGGSVFLAMEAANLLSTVFPKFVALFDSHIQASAAATMSKEDVILIFSYSGATKDNLELIMQAHEVGAKVILVTRYLRSPGANLSDIVLQCGADESPLELGTVGAKVTQLFIMDLLFKELCRRNPDEVRKNREKIAEAIAQKHI